MDGREKRIRRLILFGVLVLGGCSRPPGKQMVVLGVDGMDPVFVERHRAELPNLSRFRSGMSRLRTTTPPQSPVAWSTFATGLQPEEHGIFDFVHLDPTSGRTFSSMGESEPPRFAISLGAWTLPLSSGRMKLFRRGVTFWELLERAGIPVELIHMPVNYPPTGTRALSGMGTPDLEGTFGTSVVYTREPANGRLDLSIVGPPNPYRRDGRKLSASLPVFVDPVEPAMLVEGHDRRYIVAVGEWSPWIRVRVGPVRGMIRLYARELHPHIQIYRSPLVADPAEPALSISKSGSFGRDLAARIGPYSTLGIPEDAAGVRQGLLTLDEYLGQSRTVAEEEHRILVDRLEHFRDGLLFFYFSEIDQDSHLLWGRDDARLMETYRGVDRAVGLVLDRLPNATVMLLSDHGFGRFDFAVNLNAKLTDARAEGLNAVYVKDRGKIADVRRQLLDWRDPIGGDRVVSSVHVVGKSWSPYRPDLIVGYAAGYRAAWDDKGPSIAANTDAWIGDHCVDAALVPGVLFGTRRQAAENPGLEDLAVTILREFDVAPDPGMKGRDLWQRH